MCPVCNAQIKIFVNCITKHGPKTMNSNKNYLFLLVGLLAAQVLLVWSVGNIYINAHELDVVHALDGALRMAEGERPHLDFMTPLGVMTFAPVALMLELGFGRGISMAYAGDFMALLMLPAIYWIGITRLSGRVRLLWGGGLVLLITASVFGESAGTNSFSMFYNRWSWAVSFLILTAVVLPSDRKSATLDGIIIGLGAAFLALCKITFFVSYFPGIALILMMNRRWRTLSVGVLAGLLVAILVTVWAGGFDYWLSYISDLRFLQTVGLGDRNGGWSGYIASPAGTFSLIVVLFSASFLSKSGNQPMAISIFLLAPGFVYSTYSNWGVEPKYLLILALFVWMGAKENRMVAAGITFLLIGVLGPTIVNISLSNLRPLGFKYSNFSSIFNEEKGGLMFETERFNVMATQTAFGGDTVEVSTIEGDTHVFQACSLTMGFLKQDREIVQKLTDLGVHNDGVLVADTFSNYWMFSDVRRLKGGAIWQYGGEYGLADASILVIAHCVGNPLRRTAVIEGIRDAGYKLSHLASDDTARFYRIIKN